jgi:hypothetical protein
MTYENPWKYQSQDVLTPPEDALGFIYMITNKLDGRRYIGKKKLTNTKTTYKMVTLKNGTKKRKKIKTEIESDWKTYHGSNTELQKDVETHGTENFEREILRFCTTLGEMSYWETYEIFTRHAVPLKTYYNTWVSVRVRSDHLPKTFTTD